MVDLDSLLSFVTITYTFLMQECKSRCLNIITLSFFQALELDVSEAKDLAVQKSFEASALIAKFEEAQATISDADTTVKALVEANETAKLQVERYKEKEASFIAENDGLLMRSVV